VTNFVAALLNRRILRGTLLVSALSSVLALAAVAPAGAVVTEVAGTDVGLQPRNFDILGTPGESPATFDNESGNAVVHGSNVFPIYWDPAGHAFHHEWVTNVDGFVQDMGNSSGKLDTIFSTLTQYRDRSNAGAVYRTVYRGSYTDTEKFPAAGCTDPAPLAVGAVTCLTDAQLREKLQAFIAREGLPKGMNDVYYLLTPPGVTVCLDAAATHCSDYEISAKEEAEDKRESTSYQNSFCSYHGDINPDAAPEGDANTILYAAIPWTAGLAGLAGYAPKRAAYSAAFDCQDGGFNPEKGKETHEKAKVETPAEEKQEAEMNAEEQAEFAEKRANEAPHIEEPHQEPGNEGLDEEGDYAAGLADLLDNQIAVEQANIVTDPLLNGWQDSSHDEVSDECRNKFAATAGEGDGGAIEGSVVMASGKTRAGTLSNTTYGDDRYYVNNVFSRSDSACVGGVSLIPRFTAPNPVNSGEIVAFDGMEASVSLWNGLAFGPTGPPTVTYSRYSWNFGDGTPEVSGFAPGAPLCETPWLSPCAASVLHAFPYGGTYQVTLTTTDIGGNVNHVTEAVTVNGPPRPGSSGPGSSGGSGSSAAAGTPPPVAAAVIISRSLKKALQSGIEVRYSVNEQVAGRFQLLLAKTAAGKLHISGTPATGLPSGTPAQIVLASHVLVTTKGGRSVLFIKLSKSTAKKLSHAKSAALLLRLTVHNASKGAPQSTTVLSKVTLSH
jgi:PKD domain